jgi:hypothetical protein
MPFLTNFFGWDFFVETEQWRGRWNGVIRIVSDEGARPTTVRCPDYRDTEAEARRDARLLAQQWSEKLERSPQSARTAAEKELAVDAPVNRYGLSGVFEEFEICQ